MDTLLSYQLLTALAPADIALLFWYSLLLDVPRYLMTIGTAAVVPHVPPTPTDYKISAVVACHNEEVHLRECVESLRCVSEIIVVDDGSTDNTPYVIAELLVEGKIAKAFRIEERSSKPHAVNVGLKYVSHPYVLILDSDTVILDQGAVRKAAGYLAEDESVGGVSLNIRIRNQDETLITRHQAIEYVVSIGMGKRMSDALGILSNVSGAAGLFRKSALDDVGGLDIEVAEDAALSMKLRAKGWKLRFAPDAWAATRAPETIHRLLMQRLRWDSSIVTIWWRKFAKNLNPFSKHFAPMNLLTSLDVVVYSILLPLLLPVYALWLYNNTDGFTPVILTTIFMGLTVMESCIILLSGISIKLLPYVPFYVIVQNLIMRPARTIFVVAEMVFLLSRRDNYIPKHQRWRLT